MEAGSADASALAADGPPALFTDLARWCADATLRREAREAAGLAGRQSGPAL